MKLLGLKLSRKVMEDRLRKLWEVRGALQIFNMPQNYFLVHFANEEDYNHALYEGPWMVVNHYLIVYRCRPFFLSNEKEVHKIVAWIRISGLPIELYNQKFLTRLGSSLGKMLKIDHLTSLHSREKLTRICVEINLDRKLVP
ncbi:PREDICTED: uncharacterized protein LOC109340938 [Lupinus angustifolius]|uniref:uncharacterized protein LOC109340938 n=1 Tax=Lupinus angustifolius TaxID=3871 RepID=UPI00092F1B41|nr:PREDICTED: uncharacterized protein LOC109340938 [Lupinus angustifolius]